RHPPLDDTMRLFVNCLPQTFYEDMRELESLLDVWRASGLSTHQLVLEVTENITREQLRRILPNIDALRSRGVRFALDDVGTGAANLELLAHMAPAFMKMDMSLTIGIAKSQRKRDLAAYLLELAQRLDAKLIAEGIEREDDMSALLALGVPLGQGFLLGHPRPHDAFLAPKEANA
ncbi:MAG: EAL domain-containing protein, partial [Myxococcota bacterium]